MAEVVGIRPFQSSLDEAQRTLADWHEDNRPIGCYMPECNGQCGMAKPYYLGNEGPAVKDSVNPHEERR